MLLRESSTTSAVIQSDILYKLHKEKQDHKGETRNYD